jgi:hypothetical protein
VGTIVVTKTNLKTTTNTTKTKTSKWPSEPEWLFNNLPVSELDIDISKYAGFVYRITDTQTGLFYIGKKSFHSTRTKTFKTGRKRRKITDESDWKRYWSSCIPLKELLLQRKFEGFKREIIHLCPSKIDLTYCEMKEQFVCNVLEDHNSLNTNIAGKFFRVSPDTVDNRISAMLLQE